MDFSNTLRMLIEENDLTQKELAKQLHLAPSTLGSYVQGSREPDFSTLKQLADYFNVSIDYLLGHSTDSINSPLEIELLRVFRSLTVEQQYICIDQSKVLMKYHTKIKEQQKRHS
ncbi:helix-turn-helix domain-containing protein [Blautia sp. Sow4_E7]|uniref:helix-turn-helix domain-containing protein n=1 Tax=Blautia sp. Sow4_E7 TaxID=3438749 RepID=UPI003F931F10